MTSIYELIGRLVFRAVRMRYRRQIRIGAGVTAVALAIAAYAATRNVPEG